MSFLSTAEHSAGRDAGCTLGRPEANLATFRITRTTTVHVGRIRRGAPADGAPERPAEQAAILVHVGDLSPTCPDCSAGTLQRTKVSRSPGHRACNRCGSAWELHRLTYAVSDDGRITWDGGGGPPVTPDPDAPVSGADGAPTHRDLLTRITPEVIVRARADAGGGTTRLDACWGRRLSRE